MAKAFIPLRYPDYLERLRAAWPYMFAGEHMQFDVMPGWQLVFENLCARIDTALPTELKKADGSGFAWVQLKEKFGFARFRCRRATDEVYELIRSAEDGTASICLRCGDAGTLRSDGPDVETLCDRCAEEWLADPARRAAWWDENRREQATMIIADNPETSWNDGDS